jgi:hypothetical protein
MSGNLETIDSNSVPIRYIREKMIKEPEIDEPPVPIDIRVPPLRIRQYSLLSPTEMQHYLKNTWDPSKTLEQNRKSLVKLFMKTCVEPVQDYVHTTKGLVIKIASRRDGIFMDATKVEEIWPPELEEIFYLLTDSPLFCRLMRSLITKYQTATYRPQRAVILFTKGEASHATSDILHHVISLKTMNQTVLSALDCTKHKLSFGGTVFHEMLHWYHQIADEAGSKYRSKSTSCIRRRFCAYNPYGFGQEDEFAKNFSNDEEYYTILGLVEEYGEVFLDPLCEASYTYEQYQYIRSSHVVFHRHFPNEKNFLLRCRDVQLLRFYQQNPTPEFGKGEFIVKEDDNPIKDNPAKDKPLPGKNYEKTLDFHR